MGEGWPIKYEVLLQQITQSSCHGGNLTRFYQDNGTKGSFKSWYAMHGGKSFGKKFFLSFSSRQINRPLLIFFRNCITLNFIELISFILIRSSFIFSNKNPISINNFEITAFLSILIIVLNIGTYR